MPSKKNFCEYVKEKSIKAIDNPRDCRPVSTYTGRKNDPTIATETANVTADTDRKDLSSIGLGFSNLLVISLAENPKAIARIEMILDYLMFLAFVKAKLP